MPSRSELVLRASAVNVDQSTYPNDSKLEQAVLYAEKHVTATSSATQTTPAASSVARLSGDQNV